MTRTTQELATRVLQRLKVIGPLDTPEAEDAASVKTFYSGQYAEISAPPFNLTWWDETEIPEEAFEALSDLIAGRIAPDFGPPRADLEASGLARLRILAAEGPTGRLVTGSNL